VGKTTVAVHLAFEASLAGRTLLWDLDPQGATSFQFCVNPRIDKSGHALAREEVEPRELIVETEHEGLDVIPADASTRRLAERLREFGPDWLRDKLRALGKPYDHVVLDCPPGLSHVMENALDAADACSRRRSRHPTRCARWRSSSSTSTRARITGIACCRSSISSTEGVRCTGRRATGSTRNRWTS
jgi:hypothetical protein